MHSFAYRQVPLCPEELSPDYPRIIGEWLRSTWEFFLYTSLFLGVAAAGMAYTSCFIQGIPCTLPVVAVMFLIVFSVYNMNRKTDEAEDALNHERRFRVTKTFEKHLFVASWLAYGAALIILGFYGITAVLIGLVPLASGIIYSMPILPKGWRFRRIKEIPVTKNLVVAGAWATSFSLLPVYMTWGIPGIESIVIFLFIFSWTFVGSVLPDIRDRSGESATGVATIPVLIGVCRSRYLLTAINLSIGAIIVILSLPVIPAAGILVLLCSLAYSQACIGAIDRTANNDFLCDVVSDGQFITIGAICLISLGFFTPIAAIFAA